METLNVQELTDLACIRYGQLVTPIDIYNFTQDKCETLLKDVVEEYTQYIPMTKIMEVTVTPTGVFLGNDVISVRNVRINNFYFSKLSPRMDRRQRRFDPHTKMLSMPMTLPVVVECGVKYPVGRISIDEKVDTVLMGDTYTQFKINNYRQGTLKVKIGDYSWNDINTDYSATSIVFESSENVPDTVIMSYNASGNLFKISGLQDLTLATETPVVTMYNSNTAVVQGLGLRDKLFIDLFIGRLMLALGNMKAQLRMEGDIISFADDSLIEQGQSLVDKTLELLMSSSTTYKVI